MTKIIHSAYPSLTDVEPQNICTVMGRSTSITIWNPIPNSLHCFFNPGRGLIINVDIHAQIHKQKLQAMNAAQTWLITIMSCSWRIWHINRPMHHFLTKLPVYKANTTSASVFCPPHPLFFFLRGIKVKTTQPLRIIIAPATWLV